MFGKWFYVKLADMLAFPTIMSFKIIANLYNYHLQAIGENNVT